MIGNFFKKKPKPVARIKYIDWDRVKTVEDMVAIFSQLAITKNIKVPEQGWRDHGVDHLLTDKTYNNANGTWQEETI